MLRGVILTRHEKIMITRHRTLLIFSSALLTLILACGGGGRNPMAKGSKLIEFFPKSRDAHEVTTTTEKVGFVQASLRRDAEEVATLAISDLLGDEEAIAKFKASTSQISGYPAISHGDAGTAILVGNRFQVQARSKAESFSEEDRKAWLMRFNLAGLADF